MNHEETYSAGQNWQDTLVQVHDGVTVALALADDLIGVNSDQQVGTVLASLAENFDVTNVEEIKSAVNVHNDVIGLLSTVSIEPIKSTLNTHSRITTFRELHDSSSSRHELGQSSVRRLLVLALLVTRSVNDSVTRGNNCTCLWELQDWGIRCKGVGVTIASVRRVMLTCHQ